MLTVENLVFKYPQNKEDTLKGLSFSIAKGEVFGFLGPSGSGKSTTQKILYKLLNGYSGNVTFLNRPLSDWSREFYQKIGVSFELPNHYVKLTAAENLKFFSSFYKGPIRNISELLEKVGLENDKNTAVSAFSKGMKMRLNFVRSLIHDPEILFLDEPTSGLDPVNAGRIKQLIRELKAQGKTIFISTHNMFDADQLCDRVALLYDGEIKALDTPDALKIKFGTRQVRLTLSERKQKEFNFNLDNLGKNEEFIQLIKDNQISTIHSLEATLEEVFIKITGKTLK
jgi:fluoroquinolone transport system ATP-binding protein